MQQKLFATGNDLECEPSLPELAPPAPTKSERENQCRVLLEALRTAGDEGCSGLLLQELVPLSYRQRISDLRKDGHKIDCENHGTGSLYFLRDA